MYKLLILLVNFGKDKGERLKVQTGGFRFRVAGLGLRVCTAFIKDYYMSSLFAKSLGAFIFRIYFIICHGYPLLLRHKTHAQSFSGVATSIRSPLIILSLFNFYYALERIIFLQRLFYFSQQRQYFLPLYLSTVARSFSLPIRQSTQKEFPRAF